MTTCVCYYSNMRHLCVCCPLVVVSGIMNHIAAGHVHLTCVGGWWPYHHCCTVGKLHRFHSHSFVIVLSIYSCCIVTVTAPVTLRALQCSVSNFQLDSDVGGCLRWEGMNRYQLRMLSNPLSIQFKVPWESIVYIWPKIPFPVYSAAYCVCSCFSIDQMCSGQCTEYLVFHCVSNLMNVVGLIPEFITER